MDTCICMAESLCSSPEITKTLLVSYNPNTNSCFLKVMNLKPKKKKVNLKYILLSERNLSKKPTDYIISVMTFRNSTVIALIKIPVVSRSCGKTKHAKKYAYWWQHIKSISKRQRPTEEAYSGQCWNNLSNKKTLK